MKSYKLLNGWRFGDNKTFEKIVIDGLNSCFALTGEWSISDDGYIQISYPNGIPEEVDLADLGRDASNLVSTFCHGVSWGLKQGEYK